MKTTKQFNEWMAKIQSVHYSNNEQMEMAFERIENNNKINTNKSTIN